MFDFTVFLWTLFMTLCSSAVPLLMLMGLIAIFIILGKKMFRAAIR